MLKALVICFPNCSNTTYIREIISMRDWFIYEHMHDMVLLISIIIFVLLKV